MVIHDELFASAKKRAAEKGCSLSALVNDALRRTLKEPLSPSQLPPFQMPTFGNGMESQDMLPSAFSDLAETDDLEPFSH